MSEIAKVYGSIVSRLNYRSHGPGYKPGPDPQSLNPGVNLCVCTIGCLLMHDTNNTYLSLQEVHSYNIDFIS